MATIDRATPLPWHKAVAQLSLLFIGALMLELAHG